VRPRLILDRPGNKLCALVTRFFVEETGLWGKMIAEAHVKIDQGKRPVRLRTVANDPGTPRQGNRTALISLGIPKLVRFDKIHLDSPIMVFSYHKTCRRPARRVLADGALAPRQRDACFPDSNASSSQPSRGF
jgi:hypothetical protein